MNLENWIAQQTLIAFKQATLEAYAKIWHKESQAYVDLKLVLDNMNVTVDVADASV